MASQYPRQAKLGATFVPGGSDDFYMPPEVISPAPQRVTPELPANIQDNLARLELDAGPAKRLSGLQSPPPSNGRPVNGNHNNNDHPNRSSSIYSPMSALDTPSTPLGSQIQDTADQPSFSPFPPLRNRPPNVPPSDQEKEAILEKARMPVLNSNDPEMQLTWAQDTLAYVEIASQNETRIAESQAARPQTPRTEHQLRVDAISIVSFLADQHHPKAEFLRGMWLEFGKFGFRIDKREAFRCYQRAAQRGYARAEYRIGMQFESSNEPDKAIKHYNLGVQAGDSASNYRLGMMTLLGQHGQPLDYARGIKLISYSAETADENAPQGAYVFGMLQARDLPQINLPEQYLPINVSGARFNIEKAAYLGFAKAQAKMGAAYELCQLGCDFDPALSLHYNALAAKQGESDADMAISKWFLCGYEGVFEKNEELAFTYAQRAASTGLPTAEFAMGYFYEVGIFARVNMSLSQSWYQKSADHGNKDAVARIDSISRSKTLSRKDHENIAVAKIQSQYGSHRGHRPDRFKNSGTPLPTIQDEPSPVNMPEPTIMQPKPGDRIKPAPYNVNIGPAARPPSVAPYPLDDERVPTVQRPAIHSQRSNPNLRQGNSRNEILPNRLETSFGDPNYRGSPFPALNKPQHQSQGPRPVSSGRGAPNVPIAQMSGSRRPSADHLSPAHGPGSPIMHSQIPSNAPQLPAIDIGFSAPPDFSGADRPTRQQRPADQHNTLPATGIPPRHQVHPNAPERLQNTPPTSTQSQMMPNKGHQNNDPARRPVSAGRPGPSAPSPQPPVPRIDNAPSMPHLPPPNRPNTERPAATPPPTASAARPPGKGPKTFQEMGVPLQKQESDCTIM